MVRMYHDNFSRLLFIIFKYFIIITDDAINILNLFKIILK